MDLADIITLIFSTVSLIFSGITVWLTLLRKGTVKMARPLVVFLGQDLPAGTSKVVLCAFIFNTAQRGKIIESMFVRLQRPNSIQSFTRWVYSDAKTPKSFGFYVGENGAGNYHHFYLPVDGSIFKFSPGEYTVETYATLANGKKPLLLSRIKITFTQEHVDAYKQGLGILFNWNSELGSYQAEIGKPLGLSEVS